MNKNTIAGIFENAADMVLFRGLCKHGFGYENGADGARCTAGYIDEATRLLGDHADFVEVAEVFRELANIPSTYRADYRVVNTVYSIALWNDTDERTVEDVREALLLAAKDLRNSI